MEQITWVHRCMVVRGSVVEQFRMLPSAAGMWTTQLTSGCFISSGMVEPAFADMFTSEESLAKAAGISLTTARAMLSNSNISEDDPHEAMERLGLALVVENEA